jgi:putative tryptophan/tyrosine transport system substrate-binding protein
MSGLKDYVDAGGLLSYGPRLADLYRRAAGYVDKIFKGAKTSGPPGRTANRIRAGHQS